MSQRISQVGAPSSVRQSSCIDERDIRAGLKAIDEAYNTFATNKQAPKVTEGFQFMTPPNGKDPSVILKGRKAYQDFVGQFLGAQPGFRHVLSLSTFQAFDANTAACDAQVTLSGLTDEKGQKQPAVTIPVYITWQLERGELRPASVRFLQPVKT